MSLRGKSYSGPSENDDFPDEGADDAAHQALESILMGTPPPSGLPEVGAVVRGTVILIGTEDVFVDIGAKAEAMIDIKELQNDEGVLEISVGDPLEASVLSVKDGIRLSRGSLKLARSREAVAEAHAAGLPVTGKVEGCNKGGLEVALPAGLRGFCPMSQIDERRVEDAEAWVGRTLEFLITEMSGSGRRSNLVLSRRRFLESQNALQADETRAKLQEGAVVRGRVVTLQIYGAFIDLGGVQGLLHISDMSHTRLSHPSVELTVGDEIAVKILRMDADTGKIALGRKQLLDDPWSTVDALLKVGAEIDGRISRVAEFGAFVELVPGIEGLVHVTELAAGKKVHDARRIANAGDALRVRVMEIDKDKRRIGLARIDEGSSEVGATPALRVGAQFEGVVARVEKFGVFVRLGPGLTGLVPNEELGTARGVDHTKMFPPDTPMRVEVIEIEDGGKKIRLSKTKVEARAERDDFERYKGGDSASGFSTLGDVFRKQLEKK